MFHHLPPRARAQVRQVLGPVIETAHPHDRDRVTAFVELATCETAPDAGGLSFLVHVAEDIEEHRRAAHVKGPVTYDFVSLARQIGPWDAAMALRLAGAVKDDAGRWIDPWSGPGESTTIKLDHIPGFKTDADDDVCPDCREALLPVDHGSFRLAGA